MQEKLTIVSTYLGITIQNIHGMERLMDLDPGDRLAKNLLTAFTLRTDPATRHNFSLATADGGTATGELIKSYSPHTDGRIIFSVNWLKDGANYNNFLLEFYNRATREHSLGLQVMGDETDYNIATPYLDPEASSQAQLVYEILEDTVPPDTELLTVLNGLSNTQQDVLRLIASHHKHEEIETKLGLSHAKLDEMVSGLKKLLHASEQYNLRTQYVKGVVMRHSGDGAVVNSEAA